jgi:hypothetical protein
MLMLMLIELLVLMLTRKGLNWRVVNSCSQIFCASSLPHPMHKTQLHHSIVQSLSQLTEKAPLLGVYRLQGLLASGVSANQAPRYGGPQRIGRATAVNKYPN